MSQVEVPKTLGSFRVEALHAKGGRADIYRVIGPLQTVHAAKLERLPSLRPHDRPHDFELEYMTLSQAKSPYLLASTAHGTWRNRHGGGKCDEFVSPSSFYFLIQKLTALVAAALSIDFDFFENNN